MTNELVDEANDNPCFKIKRHQGQDAPESRDLVR